MERARSPKKESPRTKKFYNPRCRPHVEYPKGHKEEEEGPREKRKKKEKIRKGISPWGVL